MTQILFKSESEQILWNDDNSGTIENGELKIADSNGSVLPDEYQESALTSTLSEFGIKALRAGTPADKVIAHFETIAQAREAASEGDIDSMNLLLDTLLTLDSGITYDTETISLIVENGYYNYVTAALYEANIAENSNDCLQWIGEAQSRLSNPLAQSALNRLVDELQSEIDQTRNSLPSDSDTAEQIQGTTTITTYPHTVQTLETVPAEPKKLTDPHAHTPMFQNAWVAASKGDIDAVSDELGKIYAADSSVSSLPEWKTVFSHAYLVALQNNIGSWEIFDRLAEEAVTSNILTKEEVISLAPEHHLPASVKPSFIGVSVSN